MNPEWGQQEAEPTGWVNKEYRDPTPWASGLTVSVLVALLSAAAVYSFGDALARVHPLLSIAVNLIAAGGAAPTAWRWRWAPVTRWVVAGIAAGVLLAWFALFVGLVFG